MITFSFSSSGNRENYYTLYQHSDHTVVYTIGRVIKKKNSYISFSGKREKLLRDTSIFQYAYQSCTCVKKNYHEKYYDTFFGSEPV